MKSAPVEKEKGVLEQYTVRLSLIVKARSGKEAEELVRARFCRHCLEWFREGDYDKAPYPAGSMLYWSVKAYQGNRRVYCDD